MEVVKGNLSHPADEKAIMIWILSICFSICRYPAEKLPPPSTMEVLGSEFLTSEPLKICGDLWTSRLSSLWWKMHSLPVSPQESVPVSVSFEREKKLDF